MHDTTLTLIRGEVFGMYHDISDLTSWFVVQPNVHTNAMSFLVHFGDDILQITGDWRDTRRLETSKRHSSV